MSISAYATSSCIAVLLATAFVLPAQSLTMQECSVKYKAAEAGGTLKGMKWNDFRKAECGANAAPAPAATTTSAPGSVKGVTRAGNAVFPTAISPKYSAQSAGKARMHTCLDQYNTNKASNANGGLKWIVKGGGYYSECNKRLAGR